MRCTPSTSDEIGCRDGGRRVVAAFVVQSCDSISPNTARPPLEHVSLALKSIFAHDASNVCSARAFSSRQMFGARMLTTPRPAPGSSRS